MFFPELHGALESLRLNAVSEDRTKRSWFLIASSIPVVYINNRGPSLSGAFSLQYSLPRFISQDRKKETLSGFLMEGMETSRPLFSFFGNRAHWLAASRLFIINNMNFPSQRLAPAFRGGNLFSPVSHLAFLGLSYSQTSQNIALQRRGKNTYKPSFFNS